MEKIWLKSYPKGVPEEIDPNEYKSLVHIFEDSVAKYSDKVAFSNFDVEISFDTLDTLSANFASYLQNGLKLGKGSRVAIMMPNLLQYPIALFGILRAGMTVVNVNPLYTARELEHQLNDSGASAIVIVENFAHTLTEVISATKVKKVITTQVGDMAPWLKRTLINFVIKYVKKMVPPFDLPNATDFRTALSQGAKEPYQRVKVGHEDIAFLQYTGGTTGVAKGAVLTHKNIVSNVLQAESWLKAVCKGGEEIIITALPLYHIFSLTANCMTFVKLGGKNILITNPRDMVGFVKELSKHPFTALTGVNTLFNALLNTAGFSQLDFSQLKLSLGGGMAVQRSVAETWQKVTGKPLLEAYGLTETSPAVTMNPMDLSSYNGTIGLPLPSTEILLLKDDGSEALAGEAGELCIKGPQVMRGYWQRPEETAKSFHNGWLLTGDIAVIDDNGFLKLVDRKKNMILVSGFNVYPNELEDTVAAHPGIIEVAAIGVSDPKSGEVVKLFIVKKDQNLTEQDVRAFCKENLTGYKCPKYIEFMDELPKSNVGKILHKDLREREKNKEVA